MAEDVDDRLDDVVQSFGVLDQSDHLVRAARAGVGQPVQVVRDGHRAEHRAQHLGHHVLGPLATVDPAGDLASLGDMVRNRAQQQQSLPDARRAAEALRTAAAQSSADPDVWVMWQSAAAAERLAWELGGDRDLLETAAAALDRALAGALPDGDRLMVFQDRLSLEVCLVNEGVVRTDDGPPAIRRLVESAHRLLDRAVRADPDQRAVFAGLLAISEFSAVATDLGRFDAPRVRGLLALAATARIDAPEWPAVIEGAVGLVDHYEDLLNPGQASDGGLGRLARAGAASLTDPELQQRMSMILAVAGYGRSAITGDARGGHAAAHNGRVASAISAGATGVKPFDMRLFDIYSRLTDLLRSGDAASAVAVAREGQDLLRSHQLSPADQQVSVFFDAVAVLGDPASAQVPEPPVIMRGGMGEVSQVAGAVMATAAAMVQATARRDIPGMRSALARMEGIIPQVTPANVHLRRSVVAVAAIMSGEMARRLPGDLPAAAHAVTLYEQARELSGGLQSAFWADLCSGLAEMLRLSGETDLARTRRIGMAALQGHAWQVFGQSGTDHALASARAAAAHADRVAGWCLSDRETDPTADEDLVAVLDAGRGLVLRATTTSRLDE